MATNHTNGAVSASVETFTVAQLKEIIAATDRNIRLPATSRINRLAAHMRAGGFKLNGESIKFNGSGHLVDGQHRVQAAILADVPLTTVVVRGVQDVSDVDTGWQRSFSHLLRGMGVHYATSVAAGVRILYYLKNDVDPFVRGASGDLSPTNASVMTFYRSLTQRFLANAIDITLAGGRVRQLIPSGVGLALFYLFQKTDEDAALVFGNALHEGADLVEGSPLFVLRRWLLYRKQSRQGGTSAGRREAYGCCVKAWNHWRDKKASKKMASLVFRSTEALPEIE